MRFSAVIVMCLPLALAAPVTAPAARQEVSTDSEALVRVVEYNADLMERSEKKVIEPTGFPTIYGSDLVEKSKRLETVDPYTNGPETGFPVRYKGDLIEEA